MASGTWPFLLICCFLGAYLGCPSHFKLFWGLAGIARDPSCVHVQYEELRLSQGLSVLLALCTISVQAMWNGDVPAWVCLQEELGARSAGEKRPSLSLGHREALQPDSSALQLLSASCLGQVGKHTGNSGGR